MDIQQNNVAVLHFNLVNQDGSTIFIRKTKLATFNLINPSAVSVPITDIGFDATLNQCWIRVPKESNATTGQYYGVLNIVDDDWGTYTTSKIRVYSVVSDADEDTKSVVFTATCLATQVTNPSGGNSPYYNTTTETWWQYSDTLKAFEDTGVGNLIKYITKNVQHLKDGTGNGSIVTCLDDEISANNTATGLCSTDLGKNNENRGESCVALGEHNYIAEGVSNATAIAGAEPSLSDVFAIGDKTAGHRNIFTISQFGDISFRPDSSQERIAILQDILDSVIKNVVYDSSKYSLTVTFYSAADNADKIKTYDLSGLKAVLKDDAVKEISVNPSTAVMTVNTINGSSQQIQLPKSYTSVEMSGRTLTLTKNDGSIEGVDLPSIASITTVGNTLLLQWNDGAEQTVILPSVQSDWSATDKSADSYILNKPTKLSSFNNDSGYDTVTSVNAKLGKYLPLTGGVTTGDIGVIAAASNYDGYSLPAAGALGGSTQVTDLAAQLKSSRSFIGSVYLSNGGWFNIISARHRNGALDGSNYGMYIKNSMTSGGSLTYNTQTASNTWIGERIILDSNNYSTYSLPISGGTLNGHLQWNANSLPSTDSLPCILGIDSFAAGGTTYCCDANKVTVGKANSSNYIKSNTWNWSGVGPQGTGSTVKKIASITDMRYLEIDGGNSVGDAGAKGIVKISIAYLDGIIISNNSTENTNFGYVITSTTSGNNGKVNIDLYLQERDDLNYYNIFVSKLVGSAISFESPSAAAITAPSGYVTIS